MASASIENGWGNDDAPSAVEGCGVAENERAVRHRAGALAALADGDHAVDAVVHALLSVEARLEELTCYVAQLGSRRPHRSRASRSRRAKSQPGCDFRERLRSRVAGVV